MIISFKPDLSTSLFKSINFLLNYIDIFIFYFISKVRIWIGSNLNKFYIIYLKILFYSIFFFTCNNNKAKKKNIKEIKIDNFLVAL